MTCLKAAVEERREQVFDFGKCSLGLKDLGYFGLKCDMMFHRGEVKKKDTPHWSGEAAKISLTGI